MSTPPSAGALDGRRVLVVDDHEDTLEVTQLVLVDAGADVLTCASPTLAQPVLLSELVDAVITDLGFGADPMAGLAVLRYARQRDAPCLVIAWTGRKELEHELHGMGFDAVVIKPTDPRDLVAILVHADARSRER